MMHSKRLFNVLMLNMEFISKGRQDFLYFDNGNKFHIQHKKNSLFLFITFSLDFEHVSFIFQMLYAIHDVTSQLPVIFTQ